ncbi:hypothetical protein N7468_005136 [Penicillium chermesinum]|uniref:Xylanolytic transcriptional activator regulatory domain-containing protein n=1 Tax=Penicillium chermesinum TaxID=63820 RepID=A0A9W9TMQ5_9EURO|nr:uncharacterized protein N7468_005136 [Penicillium chermesinum]KAJ5232180.1 hypothetical protein N7468_005136 [Penicillium chermesinum]
MPVADASEGRLNAITTPQEYNSRCVACSKAHSECLFDSPPDGVLRGHAYVATLEARYVAEQDKPQGSLNTPQMPRSDIAVLDILPEKTFDSAGKGATLPALPSDASSRDLVDAVYFYTQARYCIIDWGRLREWHRDRATIAYTTDDGPVDSQTGILADLVGVTIRLCVKMKYHRKKPVDSHSTSPYDVELQKRFFWCAYCFDRLVSMLSKLPFAISDRDIDVETPVDINDTCTDGQKIRNLQLKQESGDRETGSAAVATTVFLSVKPNVILNTYVCQMTAAIHHLRIYRIRSRILTQSTGINGHAPSLSDVERFLFELDTWRQEAPLRQDSQNFPQQNPDRVQANYFQAVLTLIRPVLKSDDVEPQLIELCVEFAADACEVRNNPQGRRDTANDVFQSAKALSLNPLTLPDRITVYHCFYGGITLLQCLAIKPTVLTPRRAHQAISACLSALAVYTRVLPAVAPFLRLYEDVSNLFLGEDHTSEIRPDSKVRALLNKIVSSDPSETPG